MSAVRQSLGKEDVAKVAHELEFKLELLRNNSGGVLPPAAELKELFDKAENINDLPDTTDLHLRFRAKNILDEIAIYRIRESMGKGCLFDSRSAPSANKFAHQKAYIEHLKTVKSAIVELMAAKNPLPSPFGGISVKSLTDADAQRILKVQIMIVSEGSRVSKSIADTIAGSEKDLENESAQFEKKQLAAFELTVPMLYLKLHDQESLNELKAKLQGFIDGATVDSTPEDKSHSKNVAAHLTTSTKVQLELKQHFAEQKQEPAPVKSEYNSALKLAKGLQKRLSKINEITEKSALEVNPFIYFAINWDKQVMLYRLVKKIQKDEKTSDIVKVLMEKYKDKPDVREGFLKMFKEQVGAKVIDDILVSLQTPTASVASSASFTFPLAGRVQADPPVSTSELSVAKLGCNS